MRSPNENLARIWALGLFFAGSLLALTLLRCPGTEDVHLWLRWMGNLAERGVLAGFAANEADYPPLSSVLLFLVARVARLLHISPFLGLKLSQAAFLLVTALIFAAWTRSLLLASLLQLSLILSSAALGYIDIYFAPTLLLALWALHAGRFSLFTLCYAIACLTKWQALIIAPFLLLYVLRGGVTAAEQPAQWREVLLRVFLPAALILAVTFALFGVELLHSLQRATSHRTLSGQALNGGWVMTHLLHAFDAREFGPLVAGHATPIIAAGRRVTLPPRLLFAALYILALVALYRRGRRFEEMILLALAGYLAYFTFNTGVHENHLFLASILAAVLAWLDPRHRSTFAIWALAANANLFVFYGVTGQRPPLGSLAGVDVPFVLAILEVIAFAVYFRGAVRQQRSV